MTSSITRFNIEKFNGKNDFRLWQIKMCALMVQQGCDAALETLPADMEANETAALIKKAYSTLILCLGDRVLREVTKETIAAGIWTKLTSLYMTKSLANRLYLKKKLYTYYMSLGTKLSDHIDEFNKLILDLANIDIEIEDGDQALTLLTLLPSSYEKFMETLLYGRESLTMEVVLATLNSRELKKRTEGTKEEVVDGLYIEEGPDQMDSGKEKGGGEGRIRTRGRGRKQGPNVLQHLQGPKMNVLQGPNVLSLQGLNVFNNAWKNNNGQYYFDPDLTMNVNVQGQGSLNYNLGGELGKFP
nr:retrovirus-related Pol polyprotein from transposon TNT 1-94 [Tanacetum cinerariifolium]